MIRNRESRDAYTLVMLTGAEHRHLLGCYQCKQAGRATKLRCERGRQLARKIATIRGRQAETAGREKQDHVQEHLW